MSALSLLRGIITLGSWTLETAALLLVAWLVTRRIRHTAAIRHLIWLTAFAAIALLPILTFDIPAHFLIHVPVPVMQSDRHESDTHDRLMPFAPQRFAPNVSLAVHNVTPTMGRSSNSDRLRRDTARSITVRHDSRSRILSASASTRTVSTWRDGTPVMVGLLGLWLAGVAAVGIQGIVGLFGLAVMRRNSVITMPESLGLPNLAARVGLNRRWELRIRHRPAWGGMACL
jgi:hypothetical protein